MSIAIFLFWLSLGALFYTYIGYGLIIVLINGVKQVLRPGPKHSLAEWPALSIIIPAFNERDVLEAKIHNTLDISYPGPTPVVIVITDGSTDGSDALRGRYPQLTWMHQPERAGKYAAIVRAMKMVSTPIVVFTDANSMLNGGCLERMIVHYADARTGGVAGEKIIIEEGSHSAVGQAEGIYWRYESFMKQQDAILHTAVGAAGELFSIRSSLFHADNAPIILDDFVISMRVCMQGFRIAYEPASFATELPSASIAEEAKRKIRISAGSYQSLRYLAPCLNPFRRPLLTFQFISRRIIRWILCPALLVAMLAASAVITNETGIRGLYGFAFIGQLFLYALAVVGWMLVRSDQRAGPLSVPFYFVFMNYCLVRGFVRFVLGKQSVRWERSARDRHS